MTINLTESVASDDGYLTISEEALLLKIRPRTLYRWSLTYQDFPMFRLPGTIRVRHADILHWLEQFNHRGVSKNERIHHKASGTFYDEGEAQ